MSTAVLLSGGIDSLVCAESARAAGDLVGCIFVDYGHPAQVPEGWKAFAFCGTRGVPLKVIHAFGLDLGDMASAEGARVVPQRNSVLLSLAANAAHSMGADAIAIGCNADDERDYPDCRGAFLEAMARALGVRVAAPLLHLAKPEIIARLANSG